MKSKQMQKFQETEYGKLPIHWKMKKIGMLFDVYAGGDIKKISFSQNESEEYKFPIYSNSLNDKGLYGFSKEFQFEPECITITARGDVGHAECRKEKFNAIVRLLVLKPKEKLSCYFVSDFINAKLDFSSVGSAVNQLTRPMISDMLVAFPPIEEQEQIEKIIFDLDSKIELLHHQNRINEQIIQTIFKSRFVDFDGQTEFVDSELGQIPKGWNISKFKDVLALLKDGSHNPPSRVENGIPFITGGTLDFVINHDKATFITKENYDLIQKKYHIQENDIFLSIVGTLGNVAIVRKSDLPISHQRSAAVLRANDEIDFIFLYCILKSSDFILFLDSHQTKTAQPGIFLGTLSSYSLVLPPKKLLKEFFDVGYPIINKIQNNYSLICALTKIRDSLSPKLMSGQIRVN